jgi:hypothetical protein
MPAKVRVRVRVDITQDIIDSKPDVYNGRTCMIALALNNVLDADILVGETIVLINGKEYSLPEESQRVFKNNVTPFSFLITLQEN